MPGKVRIGTSGFSYKHWKGVLYPDDVPQRKWLEHYATQFDTVELNSTFYHLPKAATCEGWRERTPPGFLFAVKLSRFITHRKDLVEADEPLATFLDRVGRLGERLGPVLVQLRPGLKADAARLDAFLALCPAARRWAVEFRNPSWLTDEVYGVLERHGAALVIHDMLPDHPRETTAGWTYLRFHGAGRRYGGCYPRQRLAAEAARIAAWAARGLAVYAYFNNDADGHAVANARDLARFVDDRRSP